MNCNPCLHMAGCKFKKLYRENTCPREIINEESGK